MSSTYHLGGTATVRITLKDGASLYVSDLHAIAGLDDFVASEIEQPGVVLLHLTFSENLDWDEATPEAALAEARAALRSDLAILEADSVTVIEDGLSITRIGGQPGLFEVAA